MELFLGPNWMRNLVYSQDTENNVYSKKKYHNDRFPCTYYIRLSKGVVQNENKHSATHYYISNFIF